MAGSGAGELRAGMRVFDAHGQLLGTVKRVLTLAEILRWPHLDRDELPPEADFPYLEVAASDGPRGPLYSGYYIPARAVVQVSDSDVTLAATRAEIETIGWNHRPGFLP
jgi:hypothetical protein